MLALHGQPAGDCCMFALLWDKFLDKLPNLIVHCGIIEKVNLIPFNLLLCEIAPLDHFPDVEIQINHCLIAVLPEIFKIKMVKSWISPCSFHMLPIPSLGVFHLSKASSPAVTSISAYCLSGGTSFATNTIFMWCLNCSQTFTLSAALQFTSCNSPLVKCYLVCLLKDGPFQKEKKTDWSRILKSR